MFRYTVMRILWLIPILLFVSFIVYGLMDLAPGTVADSKITEDMTQEDIDRLYASYDLDKPMIYRYGKFLLGVFKGDLGNSQVTGLPVAQQFFSKFPNTLSLSFLSVIIATLISIPLGIFNAKHAGTILDNLVTALTTIGMSMPSFWLGLMLLIWFAGGKLRIFPAAFDGTWKSYVLPVVANGVAMSCTTTRQTRSSILEVSRADFLRTARAKGVPERQVMTRHELSNAWIPIITQLGMLLGITLAGSAVIESVYSWPGVGNLMVEAISRRDSTMACGCVILTATLYTLVLLVVDLIYAFVDPRVKAAYAGKSKKKKVKAA